MTLTSLKILRSMILGLIAFAPAQAATVTDMYSAAAAVMNVDEPERQRGFRAGLEEVIIRLTGDAGLKGSYRIEPILDFAPNFVVSHTYKEALDSPEKRDEQTTSGYPHSLAIQFDKTKLDSAIEAFGLQLWSAERPLTAVFLGVKDARGTHVLTAGENGAADQRNALQTIAAKRGLPIVLPAAPTVPYEAITARYADALTTAAKGIGADSVLFGALEYDGYAYWSIQWTLIWFGHDIQTWENRGVTLDAALHDGLEKSATIYSVSAAR